MNKPGLLIPITIQFSVRYVLRSGLLDLIKEYAEPVIALGWHEQSIEEELKKKGIAYVLLPNLQKSVQYQRVRRFLESWHDQFVHSPTQLIDEYRNQLISGTHKNLRVIARNSLYKTLSKSDQVVDWAKKYEKQFLLTDTNIQEYISILQKISPDFVLSTLPGMFHEEIVLRAANLLKIPIFASILSFDNITTHNWNAAEFAGYCVWNKYNKDELLRIYPQINADLIAITGSPQFDFYYDDGMFMDEEEWRRSLGIPMERKIILFGASPEVIAPVEPHWLSQIDHAISDGRIHDSPIILFRRHPVDASNRWQPVLESSRNIINYESWHGPDKKVYQTNITNHDLIKLASALKYSDVHVNASSTMTVDGAILGRPQIGPAYDDQAGRKFDRAMRELYLREHYLPITNSGGLSVCHSELDLIYNINHFLDHPEDKSLERKKLVQEICTFDDGMSTKRIAEAIRTFINLN